MKKIGLILLSTLFLTACATENSEGQTESTTDAISEEIVSSEDTSHDHADEEKYADVDEIVIEITDAGYVTMHGDHPHSYNGSVPEDALISTSLLTDQEGELVSEHTAGQVVNVHGDYLFYAEDPESEYLVELEAENEETHDHEHSHEFNPEDVIGKEGDNYITQHGDHTHEIPASDLTEEERQAAEAQLAEQE
jgi:hypothetical protein